MLPLILGALAGYGIKKIAEHCSREQLFENLEFKGQYQVQRSLHATRLYLAAYFRSCRGCTLRECTPRSDHYLRGDRDITRLPWTQDVSWFSVPVSITLRYHEWGAECRANLTIRSIPGLQFEQSCVSGFHVECKNEFELGLQYLNRCCAMEEPTSPAPPPKDTHAADFAALGLQRGASWVQVQAAYRDKCLKYHPDRLAANTPPHLVELAVERFKTIADAYQRLKQHLSRA